MPDPTSVLYDTSKKLTKENKNILMSQAAQDALSQREIEKSPFIAPKLTLGTQAAEPLSKYEDYLSTPASITAAGDFNLMRAQNQSLWEQVGNTIIRAAADIPMQAIGNLASIVDLEDYYNVDDEVGNGVSQLMSEWQEKWKERNPIYRERPGQSFDIGDPGWWMDNASNLLDSAGGFVLTGYLTGGIMNKVVDGIKSGTMSTRAAAKIDSTVANMVANGEIEAAQIPNKVRELTALYNAGRLPFLDKMAGVANAVVLNQAESIMEGMGVYKDVYDQSINEGKSFDDSHSRAANAAALDVNINRANILLNLSSAGMFTKANKAINELYQVGKYGLKRKFVGETVQEGLEEGVNYIAQMEGMQQAKDGANYQWDTARALGHLAEPQGLESMFLGMLGGGLQTALTEGVIGKKEEVKKAVDDVTSKEKAANPTIPTRQERQIRQNDYLYQYFQKKMSATSQEEHDAIDNEYLHQSGPLAYVGGELNVRLGELDRISKLTPDETVSQDEIDMAKKAIPVLQGIKKIGDEVTLDEEKRGQPYENKEEIIRAKIALNSAKENLAKAESDLAKKITETQDYDQLKPYEDAVIKAREEHGKLDANYNNLIGEDVQAEAKKANIAKEQERIKKEEDAKAAEARKAKSNPDVKKPQTKGTTKYKFIRKAIDGEPQAVADHLQKIEDQDGKVESLDADIAGGPSPISTEDLVDITGDENTASIFEHPNGETYMVLPALKRSVQTPQGYQTQDAPPTMGTVPMGQSGPAVGSAIKGLFLINRNNPNLKINVGRSTFTFNDFVAWARDPKTEKATRQGAFTDAEIESYLEENQPIKLADLNKFLTYMAAEDNSTPEAGEVPDPIREFNEPEQPMQNMAELDSDQQESLKREEANAINYLAEQYTIDLLQQAGPNKRYMLSGTGVLNREYLINADRTKVKPGAEIIIEPYEEVVPMVDYENGKTIIVDGKKRTSNHNAASALAAGREIPIVIRLKSTGEILGFLPETQWLQEGTMGDRVHLKVVDPATTDRSIAMVDALRQEITSAYANQQDAKVESKILSVSYGVPIIGTDGLQSVSKVMPKLDSDVKSYGVDYPFAYYDASGKVYGYNKAEISNIVNIEQLAKMRTNNGAVIVLLPAGNGKLYARVASSSRISDGDSDNILGGLMAAAGHPQYAKSASTYDNSFAKTHGFDSISTSNGLRQYLQQYMFMHNADSLRSPNARPGVKVVVVTTKNGAINVEYGVTGEGGGKIVDFAVLASAFKSGDDGLVQNAEKELQDMTTFIGGIKANFDISKLADSTPVIGINKNGFSNVANNYLSRYMKTIQTNIKSEKNNQNKQVYLIQQVVTIDVDPKNTMSPEEKIVISGEEPDVPIQPAGTTPPPAPNGDVPVKKTRRNLGEAINDGNILPDSTIKGTDRLQSVAMEPSPTHDADPGSTEDQGEKIRSYCSKK